MLRKAPWLTEEYKRYLESYEWKVRRMKKLTSVSHTCEKCGAPATEIHHLNYDALWYGDPGTEKDDDLMALCDTCHLQVHRIEDGAKKHDAWVWRVEAYAKRVWGDDWEEFVEYDEAEENFRCFLSKRGLR